MMRICIVNGTVHTAVSPKAEKTEILIEDGKIVEIGNGLARKMKGKKCTVVDAQGMQVYPGLVEAHCHLGLHGYAVGYDEDDFNEYNNITTPELRATDGINPYDETVKKARESGVTCVGTGPGSSNVIGGTFAVIKTIGRRVDDMVIKAPAAMKCAFGENPKRCYQSKCDTTRMSTAALLREMLFKAREYMRKIDEAEKDKKKTRPDFNFKLESLLPVLRREIPLKAHVHQANDIFTAIRIAKEFNLKLTLEHVTEGHLIADILAKEGYPLAVGPSFGHASKPELKNKSFITAGILSKAGCRVSIVTDSPVMPQEFLGLAAGLAVHAGMDPYEALRAITINPAAHLGVEDRVGSIEVGKDADIIIADGSIMNPATSVKTVFINGEKVFGE